MLHSLKRSTFVLQADNFTRILVRYFDHSKRMLYSPILSLITQQIDDFVGTLFSHFGRSDKDVTFANTIFSRSANRWLLCNVNQIFRSFQQTTVLTNIIFDHLANRWLYWNFVHPFRSLDKSITLPNTIFARPANTWLLWNLIPIFQLFKRTTVLTNIFFDRPANRRFYRKVIQKYPSFR